MTGFINVNKVAGVSSAREVAIIKRLTGEACGHMGTLDPMASGVLPIGIGNACRLFDYFLTKKKRYVATFRFGQDSDTLDITGQVVDCGSVPTLAQVQSVLPRFIGDIMQVPPNYSAKSVNGKRGYQLAREGVEFSLPAKQVTIDSLTTTQCAENEFCVEIVCGGGTYVRSLGRDIAAELGTHAIMSSLIRTQSGAFDIKTAVSTESLSKDNISAHIIPTQNLLPFPEIHFTGTEAKKLLNGLSVSTDLREGTYKIFFDQGFYGLAEVNKSILRIRVKLC